MFLTHIHYCNLDLDKWWIIDGCLQLLFLHSAEGWVVYSPPWQEDRGCSWNHIPILQFNCQSSAAASQMTSSLIWRKKKLNCHRRKRDRNAHKYRISNRKLKRHKRLPEYKPSFLIHGAGAVQWLRLFLLGQRLAMPLLETLTSPSPTQR